MDGSAKTLPFTLFSSVRREPGPALIQGTSPATHRQLPICRATSSTSAACVIAAFWPGMTRRINMHYPTKPKACWRQVYIGFQSEYTTALNPVLRGKRGTNAK